MKTFITGATGFIGTHLLQRMAQIECTMCCLARATSQVAPVTAVGGTIVTGDVADRNALLAGMRGCDAVIHLANVYSFWEARPECYAEVNIAGTRNVMECALEAGVAKVIHVSSMVVYGKPADVPFTEESPVGPERFSEYARTKYEGDLIAWELHRTKGLPLVAIYPSGVLGPGDTKPSGQYVRDVVQRRLPAKVLTKSVLTWVHVGDVAEAICRALQKEGNVGQKYLVGKHMLTIGELNQIISEISGVPLPWMTLPDAMVTASAALLTGLADLIKRPPLWGMSRDQIRTMKEGFRGDGSKAERELGLVYTPIRQSIAEEIAFYRGT